MMKLAVLDRRIPYIAWRLCPVDAVLRDDICQMMNEEMLKGETLRAARFRAIDTLRSPAYRNRYSKKWEKIYFSDPGWLEGNFPEAVTMEEFASERGINDRLEVDIILDSLKPEDALLMRLKYLEGWTFQELSRYFDEKANTLAKRCSVIRAGLREKC